VTMERRRICFVWIGFKNGEDSGGQSKIR